MSRIVQVPRGMAQMKPPHGSPCNRCGVCCFTSVCDLGQAVLGVPEFPGPCPALIGSPGAATCGLVAFPAHFAPERAAIFGVEAMSEAALLIISAGEGCDTRFNGEPRNLVFDEKLTKQDDDAAYVARLDRAAALWRR